MQLDPHNDVEKGNTLWLLRRTFALGTIIYDNVNHRLVCKETE